MDKIVALCKNRGFIFPGSEIYGGIANSWDYGPLGVEFKNNVKKAWWKKFVQECKSNVGLDSAIIMNPQTWVASGHVGGFSDPLMDCKTCKTRHRADKLIEEYAFENGLEDNPAGWTFEQMADYIKEKGIVCPCCGGGDHICACLDLVGDNCVVCSSEILCTLDLDYVGACAHDVCAERVEEVCKVNYMRLFGSIFDNGLTCCSHSCKHCVDGCAYGYLIKIYLRADKSICADVYHSVVESANRTQSGKCLEMLVNGSVAEIAAAWHWNSGSAEFSEKRSEKIIRASHMTCKLIGNDRILYV